MNEQDIPEGATETNQGRRIRESLSDLPAPWESNRPSRTERELLSRHVTALRARLDVLVRLEDQFGDEQKSLHRQRAERNALIYVLRKLAHEHIGPDGAAAPTPSTRMPDRAYVKARLEQAEQASDAGYATIEPSKPGLLFHNKVSDAQPIEVPLPVWFYFAGAQGLRSTRPFCDESSDGE